MLTKIIQVYDEGKITDSELRIQLMRQLTTDSLPELLGLVDAMPQGVWDRIKEDALAAETKRFKVFWMGSHIHRDGRDLFKEASDEYNAGLKIVRDHLCSTQTQS